MKFGLYNFANPNADPHDRRMIRCVDGHFDMILVPEWQQGGEARFQQILNAPPCRPVRQDDIIARLANNGVLHTYSRVIAKMFYGVPDDVELYVYGDFGVGADMLAYQQQKAAKTERIHLRISPSLKQQLQIKADTEGRTISNYIENLIRKDLGLAAREEA